MTPASGDPELPQAPPGASAHREPAEEKPSPRSRLRWSWWWLFPIALAVWISISVTRKETDSTAASRLLAQSLADAQGRRFEECLTAAREAIQANPQLAEAHNNAGWCAANLGRWDEGIGNVREALRLKPDLLVAKNNLEWMLSQKAAANAPLPAATPADSALLVSQRSAQEHRYPECVDAARQALALEPDMAEAYNNLGFCYASMGKWDDGITSVREALRIRPDFPLAQNNLSWMLAEKTRGRAAGR